MSENLEVVKTVLTPFTALVISPIVETWIKPRLAKLNQDIGIRRKVDEHLFISKFDEYLQRTAEKQAYLRTLVYRDTPKELERLYLPLHVLLPGSEQVEELKIDSYREDFIPWHHRLLLTDAAGMGKSTLLRFLFLSCIRENKGVPVFIELRRLSSDHGILDEIIHELNAIDETFEKDFVLKLIRQGGFVFFLDGYDEIPLSEREKVTIALNDFISKANKNDFIISSRPENALSSFANFRHCTIRPLLIEEAYALLHLYDEGRKSADLIIQAIGQSDTLRRVYEFLANPFLVSLLYRSFAYHPAIPETKHLYYELVFEALFEVHDLSKDAYQRQKRSGLNKFQFHSLLRALAFITCKNTSVEYGRQTLLGYIQIAAALCSGFECAVDDFLDDLLKQVPLFIRDGDMYRWSHKSIQDYFAASYICVDGKENQERMLENIFDKYVSTGAYANIIDLCYDMGYKEFRNAVIYPILSDLVRKCTEQNLLLHCFGPADEHMIPSMLPLFCVMVVAHRNGSIRKTFGDIETSSDSETTFAHKSELVRFRDSRVTRLLDLLGRRKASVFNLEACPDVARRLGDFATFSNSLNAFYDVLLGMKTSDGLLSEYFSFLFDKTSPPDSNLRDLESAILQRFREISRHNRPMTWKSRILVKEEWEKICKEVAADRLNSKNDSLLRF